MLSTPTTSQTNVPMQFFSGTRIVTSTGVSTVNHHEDNTFWYSSTISTLESKSPSTMVLRSVTRHMDSADNKRHVLVLHKVPVSVSTSRIHHKFA